MKKNCTMSSRNIKEAKEMGFDIPRVKMIDPYIVKTMNINPNCWWSAINCIFNHSEVCEPLFLLSIRHEGCEILTLERCTITV